MFGNFWKNNNLVSKNIQNYDRYVNQINCEKVWKCPQKHIINNYRVNIDCNHLEIGPGTGYFLKKENLNINFNKLTLVDVNRKILNYSKENLQSECSDVNVLCHDLFTCEIPSSVDFNSVGINYVLHCVPGNLQTKLDKLISNLGENKYNLFGASVICDPLHMNAIAEYELIFLNAFGIFNNNNDTYEELKEYLDNRNLNFSLKKQGYVAIFNIQVEH